MLKPLFITLLAGVLAGAWPTKPAVAEDIPDVYIVTGNLLKDCRGQIDYAASLGVGLQGDFVLEPVYGGWGYHYILDFKKFPEARVFDQQTIERNRAQFRANLKYAAQKGVKIYLAHYNFCATKPFVDAHPEVNKKPKLRLVGAGSNVTPEEEKTARVCGDLCWQTPVYRDFMVACWTELFETYPEIDGLALGYCEFNNCPDERSGDEYIEATRSFFSTFNDTLTKLGKKAICRAWGQRKLQLTRRFGYEKLGYTFLPNVPIYMMRYSLYDNVTTEPDEEFDVWRQQGRNLWCDVMSHGENVGPFHYLNPKFQHAIIASLVKRNVKGLRIVSNDPGGTPLFRMNQHALIRYAKKFEPYNEIEWVAQLAAHVGTTEAASVLHACEDASTLILNLPRVLSMPEEGFNISGFYYFPPFSGWPGTLGTDTMNPAPEWRRGLMTFREIIKTCVYTGYTDDIAQRLAAGRQTPFQMVEAWISQTERGQKQLEAIRDRLVAAKQGRQADHVNQMAMRTKASVMWGHYWDELMYARLFYEGAFRADSQAQREKCVSRFRERYDASIKLLEEIVTLLNEKGNLSDTLKTRKEHRAKIIETANNAVTNPPKRPKPVEVGAQVLRNPQFKGTSDPWSSTVFVGEASFNHQQGRDFYVSIASSDANTRGAWCQGADGAFGLGKYRLHVRYRLEDVRGNGMGGVIRIISRNEAKQDGSHTMLELGKGMSRDWQVLDRDLTFSDDTIAIDVNLFLWLCSGKVSFSEVTLTRIE